MNKKTTITIISILALALIAGSFWIWQGNKEQSQTPIKQEDVWQEVVVESEEEEQEIEEEQGDPYAGWKTYRNEEYGFEMRYPNNWSVSEIKHFQEHFKKWAKYMLFTDDDNEYYLTFLFQKIGEDFNTGRTGMSAGDSKNIRVCNVEEIDIKMEDLVYENKIREMHFSGKNDSYNLFGYFSYSGNAYDNNFVFDKTKLNIAETIIKSFKFTK